MANIFFLDRPKQGNSLDLDTSEALLEFARSAVTKKRKGIIVASKHAKIYCSGGDLKAYRNLTKARGIALNKEIRKNLHSLSQLPLLIIAAIDGITLGGGCELALACDLITTTPKATFAFKQTEMGVTPGWGGLGRLLNRVPAPVALRWLTTAQSITASEANRTGLSDFIFPPAKLLTESQALIEASSTLVSIKTLKELVYTYSSAKETKAFDALWGQGTHKEQLRHFFE